MKQTAKLCVAILSISAVTGIAHAATPGAYAGLGLGSSKVQSSDHFLFDNITGNEGNTVLNGQSRKLGGVGGRIFAGYNFNKYVGLEMGYASYAKSKYKTSLDGSNSSIESGVNALDVVGKGYLPIGDSNFNVYGLAGLAYARSTVEFKDNGLHASNALKHAASGSVKQSKIRPVIGMGASYDIPQTQLTTNLEFSHIQGSGNVNTSANAMPSANLLTLNLSYNFG